MAGIFAELCGSWNQAEQTSSQSCLNAASGKRVESAVCLINRQALPLPAQICSSWGMPQTTVSLLCITQGFSRPLHGNMHCSPWNQSQYYENTACSRFQQGISLNRGSCFAWQQSQNLKNTVCNTFQTASSIARSSVYPWQQVASLQERLCLPWQQAKPPCPCGITSDSTGSPVLPPEPPPNKPTQPPTPTPTPKPKPPTASQTPVPSLPYPTVFIMNEFSLIDIESGNEAACLSASVGTDKNSYAWQFELSLPYHTPETLLQLQREWAIRINGFEWRMITTGRGKSEQFGQTTHTLRGFSPSVLLTAPFAPTRNMTGHEEQTAKALAQAELERIDLSTGFTLEWQITDALDWVLPENALSYRNQTPMQVIRTIATAGGGWVYSDMMQRKISVMPDYPQPFWAWTTPDLVIPDSLIFTRSTNYSENPPYNGVYVSGIEKGVTAFVKRQGTAGDYQADMVTDALIGDEAAARQRGISVLSKGGRIETLSLEMPLHRDIGVIKPNTLLHTGKRLGLSDKVSIAVSWDSGLKIRQTVEVEQHLDADLQ